MNKKKDNRWKDLGWVFLIGLISSILGLGIYLIIWIFLMLFIAIYKVYFK